MPFGGCVGQPEFFDYDALTQARQYLEPNEKGEYRIITVHDDSALLAANAEERKYHRGGERWGEGRIHTRLPPWKLLDLVKEGVLDPDLDLNTPRARKWFNSTANIFKVRHGRI
jgi:hypothetical protein